MKTYGDSRRTWWEPFKASVAQLDRADPLERQLAHFLAVIRGAAKPLVTARDGLQNLRIATVLVLLAAACFGLTRRFWKTMGLLGHEFQRVRGWCSTGRRPESM